MGASVNADDLLSAPGSLTRLIGGPTVRSSGYRMDSVRRQQTEILLPEGEKLQVSDSVLELHIQHYTQQRRERLISRLLLQVTPLHFYRQMKRLGYALTPTFVRYLIWREQATPPRKFPTSYLNGLRGVTAVKVFTFHCTFAYSDFGFQPWGIDDRHKYLLELPIIRYVYSGSQYRYCNASPSPGTI